MKILKRKDRTLSLRITDEQYRRLCEDTLNHGARSVSDYARDTLCHPPNGDTPHPSEEIDKRVATLHSELLVLTRELDRLRRFIGLDAPR
jgi:hypothetical protein